MLAHNLIRAGAEDSKLMIEDCFQTVLYQGTGSSRTITNGLDMASGSMIWLKSRSAATDHAIYDTVRGATYDLASNTTATQTTQATGVTGFGATGFSMGELAKINTSGATYAAWTFKKAAKFFDVVQVSHTTGTSRTVAHALGCAPGMVVAKDTGATSNWFTWHRGLTASNNILLNTIAAQSTTNAYISVSGETVTFSSAAPTGTYIFYLFAHDDSADGVVQCGSFTTDGSGNATVELGWEPQYWMVKRATGGTDSWYVSDVSRGFDVSSTDRFISPNTPYQESNAIIGRPTATGWTSESSFYYPSSSYIYLAIRRGPMRVPTDGTKVYNAIARTGTGAAATVTGVGFAPDVNFIIDRTRNASSSNYVFDRLRGVTPHLSTNNTNYEMTNASATSALNMDGTVLPADTGGGTNYSGTPYIDYFFRRAPGFFDIVCYTGTGVARTIAHGLKSVPGMIWVKCRSNTYAWQVYHKYLGAGQCIYLNMANGPDTSGTIWNDIEPTLNYFSLGTYQLSNTSAATYTAYLFGDTPGLCKAFSYTGNGSNQDIALGFAPRFVLIKRTDSTGDWFVVDSTRGIVSGADPSLLLNSTAAEVTSIDFIDPIATGFNIAQETTNNLNVNAATFIGWACA